MFRRNVNTADAARNRGGNVDPQARRIADELSDHAADTLVSTWYAGMQVWPDAECPAKQLARVGLLRAGDRTTYKIPSQEYTVTPMGAKVAALLPVDPRLEVIWKRPKEKR